MIENHDILCFCNDWGGDPLSKIQIARRLARKNRILWVNSTGIRNPTVSAHDFGRAWKKVRQYCEGCISVEDNIWVFSPLVIPFHGNHAARWINQRWLAAGLRRACRDLGFRNPMTLSFVPTSAAVAGSLGESRVIYYCVDEYSRFTGADRAAILEMEQKLIAKSDLVVVSASRLYQSKRSHNPNTVLITHGVDLDHFRKACLPETQIPRDCPVRRPAIGFFGLVEDWVDLEVIRFLAAARPDWSFPVIGEVRTNISGFSHLPNVVFLGRRDYGSLPGYCKGFDVAILPFVVNELTLSANPLKLREYLAAGLPVVASPIPEVAKFSSIVRMAATPQEYLEQVDGILSRGEAGPRLKISRLMENESWDAKVEQLSEYVVDLNHRRPVAAGHVA
ncbi:MAG TPA: glycosyltransferase [Bryobacteraceae bacterium]